MRISQDIDTGTRYDHIKPAIIPSYFQVSQVVQRAVDINQMQLVTIIHTEVEDDVMAVNMIPVRIIGWRNGTIISVDKNIRVSPTGQGIVTNTTIKNILTVTAVERISNSQASQDFKTAIAGSPKVGTSAAAVHGTPIDQSAVFVPATGDSGDNTIALGHNVFVNAAGSTGNDTYIITDSQTGDARIFDLRGDNTIVLADGLNITSGAMNASFQYELTLDNGAIIAIDNAEAYDFQVGDSGLTTDFTGLEALLAGGPVVVSSTPLAPASIEPYRIQLQDSELHFEQGKTDGLLVLKQELLPQEEAGMPPGAPDHAMPEYPEISDYLDLIDDVFLL